MARTVERLSPTSLRTIGTGFHPDGRGLYFQVKNGGRSWVLRYMLNGKARYLGLGPFPDVTLAYARKAAAAQRALLRDGIDPVEARRKRQQEASIGAAQSITFEECASRYIEANKAAWRNAKHAAQWESTLKTYAYPVFGGLPVETVDTGLLLKALEPIWTAKAETATRVRQRIEAVLNWATARGYRKGENPARLRGHLDMLLPKLTKASRVKHHEAMAYSELPAFFAEASKRNTISAKALIFTILTAARSGEVRGATLSEVDFTTRVWTIPGSRTKSGREHRVPLTDQALELLKGLEYLGTDRSAVLFPNYRGKPLSDTAMRKYLQDDLERPGLTVHGFRSTFRDWAAERTNFPREVAEAALAHVLKDKTEAAYQRGDLLVRRRKLMEAWAKFCASGAASPGKVISIRPAAVGESRGHAKL